MPRATHTTHTHLSRRERQIMDVVYRLGRATVGEVMEQLSGEPAYSTVRAQLRVLEEKGHLRHEEHGLRYVYLPKLSRTVARQSALKHLIDTFFEGSAGKAVAALLGKEGFTISEDELERISELIEKAKNEERNK
jgi:BlaI family transcriptional regulator, penicillinase repressor